MSDNTSYVILSEIRDLLRQSVELQKQTLAQLQEQSHNPLVSDLDSLMPLPPEDFFSVLYGEHVTPVIKDSTNRED